MLLISQYIQGNTVGNGIVVLIAIPILQIMRSFPASTVMNTKGETWMKNMEE
jgi:hypothetical protein